MPGHLYRRPSGIYAVRIVVPQRLRKIVGRSEVHASTRLRERNAATLAGLQILLAWRQRFMELDRSKLESPNPLLLTDGMISLRDAAALIGISLPALLGELLNNRAPLYVQAQGWHGWWVSDLDAIDRDEVGAFILNAVEAYGERRILAGVMARPYDCNSTLGKLIASSLASVSLLLLSGKAAFFLEVEQEVSPSSLFVQKLDLERIRARLAAHLPPAPEKPVIAPAYPNNSQILVLDPITAKHGNKRFSQLFELYRNDRIWKKDHADRMEKEARLFCELMNDPELGQIEAETIQKFGQLLARLPKDIYLSRRRYQVDSLRELISIAEEHNLERKQLATIKRHVSHISEIFNYGVKKRLVSSNPAAEYKRGRINKKAQSDRERFTQEELTTIFSQAWYKTGSSEGTGKHWRPFYYWLPLMGLLTGARINELSQLYLDDVAQTESGTWYFDFNLTQPDKIDVDSREGDKSLKTVNAERVVPMHTALINLGLPEYVAALRKSGYSRLFPELHYDSVKGYGKPAGAWFNERFLGRKLELERNGKKVFHSFRHNFSTALERLDVSESVRAMLAGHQRGETESGTRYTKDRNADEMKSLIDKLYYPFLSAIVPFNVSEGIKAVKYALLVKNANLRRKSSTGT
jgi:integrase